MVHGQEREDINFQIGRRMGRKLGPSDRQKQSSNQRPDFIQRNSCGFHEQDHAHDHRII